MKMAVWDTYVSKKDGSIMHFDILVPNEIKNSEIIFSYGRKYLTEKQQEGQSLNSKQCNFCHVEEATTEMIKDVALKGYHIIEIDNCD